MTVTLLMCMPMKSVLLRVREFIVSLCLPLTDCKNAPKKYQKFVNYRGTYFPFIREKTATGERTKMRTLDMLHLISRGTKLFSISHYPDFTSTSTLLKHRIL